MTGLTKEDFKKWITPMEALDILRAAFTDHYTNPRETLLSALTAGVVTGVAGRSSRQNGRIVRELEEIQARTWEDIVTTDSVWTTSHTIYTERTPGSYGSSTKVSVFGVKFNPDAVRKLVPESLAVPSKPRMSAGPASRQRDIPLLAADDGLVGRSQPRALRAAKNVGGRPKKEFWDDFWIEICRQIYEGSLIPKTQADLQRAMEQWVSDHGHDAGETVMKAAAKKLFNAWKLGVGN